MPYEVASLESELNELHPDHGQIELTQNYS